MNKAVIVLISIIIIALIGYGAYYVINMPNHASIDTTPSSFKIASTDSSINSYTPYTPYTPSTLSTLSTPSIPSVSSVPSVPSTTVKPLDNQIGKASLKIGEKVP